MRIPIIAARGGTEIWENPTMKRNPPEDQKNRRHRSALEASCQACGTGVDLHTAAQTRGYCRACAPALPGLETHVSTQVQAAAETSGAELTRKMREPAGDVSRKAGNIERSSPLFRGSGDFPTLF